MLHCDLLHGCCISGNNVCGVSITRFFVKREPTPPNSLSKVEETFNFKENKSIIRFCRTWNFTLIQWTNSLKEHSGI